MPEICFSSGLATEVAMVSGSAPDISPMTMMYGNSTLGMSFSGRRM